MENLTFEGTMSLLEYVNIDEIMNFNTTQHAPMAIIEYSK